MLRDALPIDSVLPDLLASSVLRGPWSFALPQGLARPRGYRRRLSATGK